MAEAGARGAVGEAAPPAARAGARPVRPGEAPLSAAPPIQMENPYKEPPKRCVLCGINVDYKNVQLLSQFVSPHTGSVYGRHITGLCNKKQKEITKAIKRAHVFGETMPRCRKAVQLPPPASHRWLLEQRTAGAAARACSREQGEVSRPR
ncbi:small ribosomal subunit protein bS18m isoform 2-T2 [Phoenicopterus ruber ruber]